jgi:hypothetical protein
MTTPQGFTDSTGTYRLTTQGKRDLELNNFWLIAGTPLAAFANGASATPGLTVDNSETGGIRWNNNATLTAVFTAVPVPIDRQPNTSMIVHIACSKSGATVGDATTFDVGFFSAPTAGLSDASANAGGTTPAILGSAAAKTGQHVQLTIAAASIPNPTSLAVPATMTISVKPTDGTLGTDDMTITGIYVEYTKIVNPV